MLPHLAVAGHPRAARRIPDDLQCTRDANGGGPVRLLHPWRASKNSRTDINDGDIFVWNDPYACKGSISHNNDWCVMMPIFHAGHAGRLLQSIFGHMVDVGGKVPGSMPADARSIWEEGLRIPPVRIYEQAACLNQRRARHHAQQHPHAGHEPQRPDGADRRLPHGIAAASTRLCDRFGQRHLRGRLQRMLLDRTRRSHEGADRQIHSGRSRSASPTTWTTTGAATARSSMTLSIYRRRRHRGVRLDRERTIRRKGRSIFISMKGSASCSSAST